MRSPVLHYNWHTFTPASNPSSVETWVDSYHKAAIRAHNNKLSYEGIIHTTKAFTALVDAKCWIFIGYYRILGIWPSIFFHSHITRGPLDQIFYSNLGCLFGPVLTCRLLLSSLKRMIYMYVNWYLTMVCELIPGVAKNIQAKYWIKWALVCQLTYFTLNTVNIINATQSWYTWIEFILCRCTFY